jgi:hypothetical protein
MGKNSSVTMDDLSGEEIFPEVQEHAIAAVQAELGEENVSQIDTSEYKIGEDGKPLYNKDGSLKKKRGRKSGSVLNTPDKKETPPEQEISSIGAATVVSGVLEQMQVVLISDDFVYSTLEKKTNIDAWASTFDYYGGVNLTPPQALALNHAAIILARAGKEKTQTKFVLLKAYVSHKFGKFKFWKKKNAHVDNRADSIGENDMGEKESGQP